jgi:hypothetical protein
MTTVSAGSVHNQIFTAVTGNVINPTGGAGLATCTLQYQVNAGDWQLHSEQCAGTESFDAQPGHTYTFPSSSFAKHPGASAEWTGQAA